MEVNVDDMVIKCDPEEEMLANIKETLERLRVINQKLNPKKCSFGIEEGIFSRHLITKQGIKENPSKVKAISNLQPPKSVSKIQNLSKKLTALNRFLSKGADKTLPFMQTPKRCTSGKMVQWTTKADEAFRRMKELREALPTGVELEYPELEKRILALLYAARRLEDISKLTPFSLEGKEYTYALRFEFETTSNEAEYEALLAGLRIAKEVKELLASFLSYSVEHIKRDQNKKADALSKLALMIFFKLSKEVLVEEYLQLEKLPDDPQKERKLRIKAPLYKIIDEHCIEDHTCRHGPRSVVSKIIRLGYYWPSMHKDAKSLIQKCETCQIHSPILRKPKQEMTSIMSAWPFLQWGIDIVGPLSIAP
ncbi:reverse transcriptase domain-containing protein [Tanacetum coccineum]